MRWRRQARNAARYRRLVGFTAGCQHSIRKQLERINSGRYATWERVKDKRREITYLSRSCRTILSTNGLGNTVSKFPLGICSTKLVELSTTATILDPRSTARRTPSSLASCGGLRRLSTYAPSSAAPLSDRERRGRNFASCEKVVKMRKVEVRVKEVASEASCRGPA